MTTESNDAMSVSFTDPKFPPGRPLIGLADQCYRKYVRAPDIGEWE
jgi:hypothetical protein